MKLRIVKIVFNVLIIKLLITISAFVFSSTEKLVDSICIESNRQILNIKENIITFIDKVSLIQGKTKINADKLIITRPNKKKREEIIHCYGNPIKFYQIQNNGKLIKGRATEVYYLTKKK